MRGAVPLTVWNVLPAALVDRYAEGHVTLYNWRGGRYDNQVTLGEGEVERISAHKERMDGVFLLLTKWKG